MKKWNWLIVAIVLFAAQLWAGQLQDKLRALISTPSASGPTCSGDFSSGQNESFENASGDGYFCTTDLTVTDDEGSIDTYSTGYAFCGSHSLAVTYDTDLTGTNKVSIDLGGNDGDFYYRQYLKTASIPNATTITIMGFSKYGSAANLPLLIRNTGSAYVVAIGVTTGENFPITVGDELRIEIHVLANTGASTLKVWRKNGASWDPVVSSNGGEDYEQQATSGSDTHRYIFWDADSGSSTAVTLYTDDVKVSLAGADFIGADVCN